MNFKFSYTNSKSLLIIKIISSILLGLVITVYVTQDQILFKRIIYNHAKKLCTSNLDYNIDFSIDQINLFAGKIKLKNLILNPKDSSDNSWQLNCDKLTVGFSWLNLLINHKIVTQLKLDKLNLNSLYQNQQLAIAAPLYDLLLAPSPVDIELKNINIKNATLNINHPDLKLFSKISWSSNSKTVLNVLKSNIYFKTGSLSNSKYTYLNDLAGNLQINFPFDNPKKLALSCELNFKSPWLDKSDQYFISAKWGKNIGNCKIKSLSGLLDIAPISLFYKNQIWQVDLKGLCDLAILQKINLLATLPKISGQCALDLSGNIYPDNYSIAGSCQIKDFKANDYALLNEIILTFNRYNYLWHGELSLEKKSIANLIAKWNWHEKKATGAFHLTNKNLISLPVSMGWEIHPGGLNLNLSLKNSANQLAITGTNQALIKNIKTNFSKKITGDISYQNEKLNLSGELTHDPGNKPQDPDHKDHYVLLFNMLKYQLEKLVISAKDQTKPVVSCSSLENNLLQTALDLSLIRNYLPKDFSSLINGSGTLIINSQFKDLQLDCDFNLTNGNLILPRIYNVVKDLTGQIKYDFKDQNLKIKDLKIILYQGNVDINYAIIRPNYIYLPVLFSNLALNFERNLITNCAGNILYQSHDTSSHYLKGFIVLEQTLCRYNLLSPDLINILGLTKSHGLKPSPNLELDLNFLTKTPIKIKSEFLDTSASAQIKITEKLINPKITGQIKINNGKINFPYKPLYITSGQIYFTGTPPEQATLDLTAKNNLKRHNITLQVSGPINSPQINLQSFPNLTSEAIGTLLLLGTENSSLNMIMPAILMQNLNNIIFGSIYDEEHTNHLIKKLFKPLDHVKFVPSFSDETGRGGLKGAIEIDVNDRLHALIQKNFSLTEDTKLEIDYAISDDVSIRAIKDERGDLGSELEIRFKI